MPETESSAGTRRRAEGKAIMNVEGVETKAGGRARELSDVRWKASGGYPDTVHLFSKTSAENPAQPVLILMLSAPTQAFFPENRLFPAFNPHFRPASRNEKDQRAECQDSAQFHIFGGFRP
jgi:hypothetical protein